MRTSDRKLNDSLKREIIRTFAQTLMDFKNLDEMNLFLGDFFNDSEIENYSKRIAVAYWLKKGRSWRNIKNNLKVSSATIGEVRNVMNTAGFQLALQKMEAEEWANVWSQKIQKFVGKGA